MTDKQNNSFIKLIKSLLSIFQENQGEDEQRKTRTFYSIAIIAIIAAPLLYVYHIVKPTDELILTLVKTVLVMFLLYLAYLIITADKWLVKVLGGIIVFIVTVFVFSSPKKIIKYFEPFFTVDTVELTHDTTIETDSTTVTDGKEHKYCTMSGVIMQNNKAITSAQIFIGNSIEPATITNERGQFEIKVDTAGKNSNSSISLRIFLNNKLIGTYKDTICRDFGIIILPRFSKKNGTVNRVSGYVVTNTRAQKGLSHVNVSLTGLNLSTETDLNGYFSIEDIKPALSSDQLISINFRKRGYIAIDTTLRITSRGELQKNIKLSRDYGIYGYLYFKQIENGEEFLIENARITTTGDKRIYTSKKDGSFWIPLSPDIHFDSITLIIRHKDFANKIIRYSIKDATSSEHPISLRKKQ